MRLRTLEKDVCDANATLGPKDEVVMMSAWSRYEVTNWDRYDSDLTITWLYMFLPRFIDIRIQSENRTLLPTEL